MADMTTTLGGLQLAGPTATASGCAAAGRELAAFGDIAVDEVGLGAAALDHVLTHRRAMLAAAGMTSAPSRATVSRNSDTSPDGQTTLATMSE